ncbi:MAG TPA: bifunctional 4-hydroxy-2-oxoglutarate aldolase/2-dehydro-3-deoxy-phosphogluconate aldolase [Nitrospira sp.]|nr:bifunctional 4-hydroxy-2-oxoglutarate aldolase/2-dehydro-3-deoxy-phosphogluconate aldolase [Nitrospira sp.]
MNEIADDGTTVTRHVSTRVVAEVGRTGIIAILRGNLKGKETEIAQALLSSGITVLEITMNSPNALQNLSTIRNKVGASLIIGAGTVLRHEEVAKAHDAGAQFIVSPNYSPDVIRATKRFGMASFPGCSTCTEMLQAVGQGADAVKVFPATTLKPEGVRAVLASLGQLRLIPTGGVTAFNAAEYFAAGAWALGVGSALIDEESVEDPDEVRVRGEVFVSIVASSKDKYGQSKSK